MAPRFLFLLLLPVAVGAQTPAAPKPPIVNDPALRIELLASYPDVEACTTVCGAPDGAIYVGNDPRDGRLSTSQPVNQIIRFSSMGADKKRTVFADKIYSPAGSAWHDGYLYVLHDPFLTRFKDTDGDGVADVREDLVTNLGIPPNEGLNDHVVSGFTLGMDGCWYISVGDRGIFEAKSVKDGSTITMQGGGIVRCRVDGTQLEIFSTGTRNHLQVNLDAEDNAFTRDNTDDGNGWWTRLTHHIEGGYYGYPYDYRKAPNYGVVQPSQQTLDAIKQHGGNDQWKMTNDQPGSAASSGRSELGHSPLGIGHFLPAMADFGGGSPTGGLCYLSDGLPESYRGKHFFSEWGKQGIFVTEVARDGATFKLVSDTKLIEPEKGADFRPMQLSVAADGSLLIADWGYGGWKSPRTAGAIWRLSWPEAKPAPRLKDESKASVDELIAALGHPDRDQRLRAQGELVKRTVSEAPKNYHSEWLWKMPPTLEELDRVMRDGKASFDSRVHAIWAISELSRISLRSRISAGNSSKDVAALLGRALSDDSPGVRANVVRAIRQCGDFGIDPISEWIADPDPRVRLEAAAAMSRSDRSYGDFTRLLADPDRWVRFVACAALREALPLHYSDQISTGTDDFKYVGEIMTSALLSSDPTVRESAWSVLPNPFNYGAIRPAESESYPKVKLIEQLALAVGEIVRPLLSSKDNSIRIRAVTALGQVAYLPTPYDGHWWGTQPVKSSAPLNSVAWSGTPTALAALTTALADEDRGVRLEAAKAFAQFIMGVPRSVGAQTSGAGTGGGAAGADPAKNSTTTPPPPAPDLGADGAAPSKALEALRARLTAENDAAVRRQLIEALGVQKDAGAVAVFQQIALDEKADAEFRETAIGAVVNIGGDAAKQTIARLLDAKLSQNATRTVIKAAGELKVLEAAPMLVAHLKDENAGNREFSARSLQQLGPKTGAITALIEATADKDGKVQAAVVDALGSYRDKAALPALIALAEKKRSMKETIGALANMPDESAIPVLVETLREKNTSVRRNAIKALKTMREKAWPQVEALLATGRVPEELVPEIKNAFESGAITQWKMVGVFENVWEAQHPPEKEALAAGGQPALSAKYHNAEGKDVGWINVTADGAEGRVDLEKVFKTNAMVCAYAFTEIEAPEAAEAKLFTSADDEIGVWLNGQPVLNVAGNHGYEPDTNQTPLPLVAGKNRLFVKIGNKGGTWTFHARIPGFDNGKFIKSKETPPDEKQRLFALAMRPDGSYVNAGDAKRGEKIFFDKGGPLGGICATCHVVRGLGGQVGPDLSLVAANYKRPDLITSIHEPSKTIALGFEQVVVETKGGEIFAGALRQETAEALTVVGADAQPHLVKKADVKMTTHVPTSLMPQGLTLGLKPGEFADLLAYLETLK